MVGRREEQAVLLDCLQSKQPEFLAVYGRYRVGKTFLIREYFQDCFAFYATGVPNGNTKTELRAFHQSLLQYGDKDKTLPRDWFEAFSRLRELLRTPTVKREYMTGRRVVFLDELPWMDTARSNFKAALDYFWNSWGSVQKDLLFILCGSATSWMIQNIVRNTGGLYNRLTCQIHLLPFSLRECEELLHTQDIPFTREQIIESYMIFGGIPYYLKYLKPQLSLAQNVDRLLFQENGPLRYEFQSLFSSLYKNPDRHMAIIEALSTRRSGLTRVDLQKMRDVPTGKELTRALEELEQCGFIRKYTDFTRQKSGHIFKLIDPLTIFHLTWLKGNKVESWIDFLETPAYYAWGGFAFERVCMLHAKQIKSALGIFNVSSHEYAWKSKGKGVGAQIDMLIDRRDGVINLCEIKYTKGLFSIDAAYEQDLRRKIDVFRQESGTKKSIYLTMITREGLQRNAHRHIVVSELTGDDLFRDLP